MARRTESRSRRAVSALPFRLFSQAFGRARGGKSVSGAVVDGQPRRAWYFPVRSRSASGEEAFEETGDRRRAAWVRTQKHGNTRSVDLNRNPHHNVLFLLRHEIC